jgi:hypothetical protein
MTGLPEFLRQAGEDSVSQGLPENVIDFLEPVEVEPGHHEASAFGFRLVQRLLDEIVERTVRPSTSSVSKLLAVLLEIALRTLSRCCSISLTPVPAAARTSYRCSRSQPTKISSRGSR